MLNFNIERKPLFDALKSVNGAIEQKQTLAILSNVLFEIKAGQLQLTGTDSELTVRYSMPIDCDGEQAATIPAKKLMDIVRAIPDKMDIVFKALDDKQVIKAGKSKFTVGCLPAEDYPSIEPIVGALEIQIKTTDLINALAATSYCMAVQDVRYYLNGLYMVIESDKVVFASTDGHRLVKTAIEQENDLSEQEIKAINAIIPRKAVLELQKLLASANEVVNISFTRQRIDFKLSDSVILSSKLIDGRFPDYESVIPKDNTLSAIVDITAFKQALSRVAILSNEKFKGVRLTLKSSLIESGVILLSSRNPERDEAEEEVECEYSGEELEIGFNAQYLLEALSAMPSKVNSINLKLRQDINGSALIEPVIEGVNYLQAVVMPMRL